MGQTRVFIAASLDGCIAGPGDELDWLPAGGGEIEDTFTPFFAQVGAVLMGRRTYDVVSGFAGGWPYGDTPVLVATHRPLAPRAAAVRAHSGGVAGLIDMAHEEAGGRDVYVDGGALIRAALDAGLVDQLTLTLIPVILGAGIPLFAGAARRHPLELAGHRAIGGGLVELSYRPRRG